MLNCVGTNVKVYREVKVYTLFSKMLGAHAYTA